MSIKKSNLFYKYCSKSQRKINSSRQIYRFSTQIYILIGLNSKELGKRLVYIEKNKIDSLKIKEYVVIIKILNNICISFLLTHQCHYLYILFLYKGWLNQ